MEIGKIYNVDFATGKYEIEYEKHVECIKITPLSYRVRRQDGSTRLINQCLILRLEQVVITKD